MKANYKINKDGTFGKRTVSFTEKQLQEYFNEQWELKVKEVYDAATKDITAQVLAVMFATLYKPPYNWRGKRMNELKASLYLNASLVAVGGFIATVLISPISEELIFRGVIFNRLKLIMPTSISILVSSLLFASMHIYGSIIAAFIFAICMAILYVKTDNIAVPIFAHFLNNFLAESIVILDVNNVLFTNTPVILVISFLAIVSAILIVASIFDEWNNLK